MVYERFDGPAAAPATLQRYTFQPSTLKCCSRKIFSSATIFPRRYTIRINDPATRYAVSRLMQLDARVWPWRFRGEPFSTTRTIDEVLKGAGMVPRTLPELRWPAFLKLTCWLCGTSWSTLGEKYRHGTFRPVPLRVRCRENMAHIKARFWPWLSGKSP